MFGSANSQSLRQLFCSDNHQVKMPKNHKAFTLVELLVVIAIIAVMLVLSVPAFYAIKGGSDITKAAYDISGVLEQARTYAMANNTYVWVGFYEENGAVLSTNPATPGTGRVVISIVAAKSGESYSDSTIDAAHPAAFGAGDTSNQVSLMFVDKLKKIDNIHIGSLNTGGTNTPPRPAVPAAYQVGDATFGTHDTYSAGSVTNPTTFSFPLSTSGVPQYTFTKIIEFNPQGEPGKVVDSVVNGPQSWLEVAIQPTHGNVVDPKYAGTTKAAVALLMEGVTGRVEMFRL